MSGNYTFDLVLGDNSTKHANEIPEKYQGLYMFTNFLDLFYVPTVIILGIIGNIISFVVFTFSPLKHLSISVYLSALGISDSLFLLSVGVGWLDNPGVELIHIDGLCQMTVYLSYVCSFLSVWLMGSYTIERYIAICHPLKRPEMCTTRKAKIVVASLCATAMVLYACTLKISGIERDEETGGQTCTPYLSAEYYKIHLFLTYVDSLITFLLPFLVILCFNIRIVLRITSMHRSTIEHVPIASIQHCPDHSHRHPNMLKICPRGQSQSKVTRLLLIISTVFLVVSLPSYVIRVRAFVKSIIIWDTSATLLDILLQQLCQYLFYLNYSINIVLYLICWRKFRLVLLRFVQKLFRSKR